METIAGRRGKTAFKHSKAPPHSKNQEERYKFCRRFVNDSFQFCDMMDRVHIDEKWFYVDTDKKAYYLTKGEESPHRVTKSKRFIPKLMFMAAVASKPQEDNKFQ